MALKIVSNSIQGSPKVFNPTDQELLKIFSFILKTTGIDLRYYKPPTIRRRIGKRINALKIKNISQYIQYLKSNPSEVNLLSQDVLIKVTSFFRDSEVFKTICNKVVPSILKNRGERPIRIWVPGCCTGEEVYSIAISVLECLDAKANHTPVQIFGTDVSEPSLDKARAGVYGGRIEQNVSKERLERYFTKVDGGYQIHKNVRAMCTFAKQNLVQDPPFSKLDLISCRNVLIYLGGDMQNKIFPMFHYALNPWGFLLLGKSETIGSFFPDLFSPIDRKHNIYAKKPSSIKPNIFQHVPQEIKLNVGEISPKRILEPSEPDLQKEMDRVLAIHYPNAAVLINESADIIHTRGDLAPFLKITSGKMSVNLLKMAREGLMIELKLALEKAKKKPQLIRKKDIQAKNKNRIFSVDLEILPVFGPLHKERYFIIIFQISKNKGFEPGAKVKEPAKTKTEKREILRLKQELEATKNYLQTILEEHENTNQELRSANEEILSSNEELQSTNEEMETAKEELESTNEELTTVNEELAARNAELKKAHDELELRVKERTEDLAKANEVLSKSEKNLSDFFENASIGLHWVGPDGTILRANRAELELLGYKPEEYIGRSIKEFHVDESVICDILDRLANNETLQNYEARLRCKDGSIKHVLISSNVLWENGQFIHTRCFTRDITDRKIAEESLRQNVEILETINQIGATLAAELNVEKLVQAVTDAATKVCGAQFGAFFYNRVSAEGESYVLYAISGVPREHFSKFPMPRNTELFGPTFAGKGIIRLGDVKKDPRYGKNAPHYGMPKGHLPVTSYLAVPVLSRSGEVLGGLFFGHSAPDVFTESHERIVAGLAAQASIAMDNAKLFENLLQGEEKFKQLANAMPQIVWTAKPDGCLDYYNDRWYEYTGFKRDGKGDESWKPILHPDDVQMCLDRWYSSVKSGELYQIEYRFKDRKNGGYRWFLGRALPVKDAEGRIIRWFGTCTDIHHQKSLQDRLQLKYSLTHIFVHSDTLKEAINIMLEQICEHLEWQAGVFWEVNEQTQELHCLSHWTAPTFSQDGEDFIKMTCAHKFQKGAGLPGKVLETGKPEWISNFSEANFPRSQAAAKAHLCTAFGFPVKLDDKVVAVVEFFAARSQKPDKELLRMMGAVGEHLGGFIEKRKIEEEIIKSKENVERANRELQRANEELERSNKELEQFAYVASHDLQEPLRMVTAYTQLLASRYKDKLDQDAEKFINYATEGAVRSQNLINDLLDYSRVRMQEKEFVSVSCEEVLESALANLSVAIQETGAEISHDPLPVVMGDKTKLTQLFQNLINNAIKFRGKDVPKVHIACHQNSSNEWVFSIKDNGIGIDPQYHDRIFVIFQRLHTRNQYAGTGIGLAICKKIVEQHHGKIWVESEQGKGSTFYFTICNI